MSTFTYQALASPLHDAATVATITQPVRVRLEGLGGAPGAPDTDLSGPFLLVVATGGTEQALLDAARHRRAVCPFEPVVLVAHPRHNSLPAALEALARLHQDGVRGRIAYVPTTGEPSLTRLSPTSWPCIACTPPGWARSASPRTGWPPACPTRPPWSGAGA